MSDVAPLRMAPGVAPLGMTPDVAPLSGSSLVQLLQ